jgi:hypothetical protein
MPRCILNAEQILFVFGILQLGTQNKMETFSKTALNDFDWISAIMTSPQINLHIFRKITVHTLGAQTPDVDFVEIDFTGRTDFFIVVRY